jgi:hypothetical protein
MKPEQKKIKKVWYLYYRYTRLAENAFDNLQNKRPKFIGILSKPKT